MKCFKLFIFLILLCTIIFGQEESQRIDSSVTENPNGAPFGGITEKEIYDFMKIVIQEHNVNLGFGLSEIPQRSYHQSKNDTVLFAELLLDTTAENFSGASLSSNTSEPFIELDSVTSERFSPPVITDLDLLAEAEADLPTISFKKCLTSRDIVFMTSQRSGLPSFLWDNTILHFNMNNTEQWYAFSLPLFSCDKTKVLIQVSYRCAGLCGSDQTILYRKENGKWISQTGASCIH